MLVTRRTERGSAPLESIFAITFLVFLAFGVVQVALILYGRNAVMSATHEGARAGAELGREPREAAAIARRTVEESAAGLIEGMDVEVTLSGEPSDRRLHVLVSGTLRTIGPVPVGIPVNASATATLEESAF